MLERRLIAIEGVVQGVGFRPFVHRLAAAGRLHGSVRNDARGVLIDIEGEGTNVDAFYRSLTAESPPLAAIEHVTFRAAPPQRYDGFRIECSETLGEQANGSVPPDVATCDACLSELFDPANRRFEHPFITCTQCGPRFTIVHDTPYDRERTAMSVFQMCVACDAEYVDPASTRFHAETIACPDCGPTLLFHGGQALVADTAVATPDALRAAIAALDAGAIVAIKALGGYHLACDAANEAAVDRLRDRKHRAGKPLAIMVRDYAAAARLCHVSPDEKVLLESVARPIVVLARRTDGAVAASVAPGQSTLGIMLPSTPLHHLLLAALDRPLVMTSGNRSDEPVVIDDKHARDALGQIADAFLTHDRAIVARCDDSVVRYALGEARMIRRARGFVPGKISLPMQVPGSVLAMGAHLKNTVCLALDRAAHVSAHVGDLDSVAARAALRDVVRALLKSAATQPTAIAHDLHPEYGSTRVAAETASELGIGQRIAVQHHHAHIAACVAEYQVRDPVIGVAFDGAGLGSDGAIWGGEFLHVDGARFSRLGHLSYVALPGGDAAARRPWRSAVSHLAHAHGGEVHAATRPPSVADAEWALVTQLLARDAGTMPRTSSVGRLFDAVASLLGLCHMATFEGEAAMALEAVALRGARRRYSCKLSEGPSWTADPGELIRGIMSDSSRGVDTGEIAGAFHLALADLIVSGCERARAEMAVSTVVLSGGVFMNAMLLELASAALKDAHFEVLVPRLLPCNDGGLSLGQAYVAACALEEELCA
ncbi:carbamoyltransferase HypF [soil metagenome]